MSDVLRVTVMGLGLNGGGVASARYFAEQGAVVTVTDMKSAEELAPSIEALQKYSIRYVLGKHERADFENADVVIKNPGVKRAGNIYLAAARHIETDISIFLQHTKAPIIAVTGSKGKSSTVSAIHYGLEHTYTAHSGYASFLGGNITVSPLTFLDKTNEHTPVVLELSSWQLADLQGRGVLKPRIALITTIVPDHQNWYGSMEAYVADKKLIYADQNARNGNGSYNSNDEHYTICKYDDYWGDICAAETKAHVLRYCANGTTLPYEIEGVWLEDGIGYMRHAGKNPEMILPKNLMVPGLHAKENLLNAALCLSVMGVSSFDIASTLASYPGIEHRLEKCYECTWGSDMLVTVYNDSAATVPEATKAALESFEEDMTLICGGTDKELDFTPLANAAHRASQLFILAGSGSDKLIPLLKARGISFEGPFASLNELLEKVKSSLHTIAQRKKGKHIIVFAPGATSFGMFKNEFDRGTQFKEAVLRIFPT